MTLYQGLQAQSSTQTAQRQGLQIHTEIYTHTKTHTKVCTHRGAQKEIYIIECLNTQSSEKE